MPKMVRHGAFTRVELLLDNAGGPLADMVACQHAVAHALELNQMHVIALTRVPYGDAPCGYILNFTLEESFVVVETWPEIRRVKVLVDLCDYKRSNEKRCILIGERIIRVFNAKGITISREIKRDPGVLINAKELEVLLKKYAPMDKPVPV